jgi:hypothetical protein
VPRARRRIDYVTKPGRHGTLYLYEVVYRDRINSAFGNDTIRLWAYDREHLEERFYDDPDESWEIISVKRVQDR